MIKPTMKAIPDEDQPVPFSNCVKTKLAGLYLPLEQINTVRVIAK